MNEPELREALFGEFESAGFRGRGNLRRLHGPEVQWVVHLERSPHGRRFALEVGLYLGADLKSPPLKACQIILYPEQLPLGPEIDPSAMLSLDGRYGSTTPEAVRKLARGVSAYIRDNNSLQGVRDRFAAGDFTTSFVDKTAREILSQ